MGAHAPWAAAAQKHACAATIAATPQREEKEEEEQQQQAAQHKRGRYLLRGGNQVLLLSRRTRDVVQRLIKVAQLSHARHDILLGQQCRQRQRSCQPTTSRARTLFIKNGGCIGT